MEDKRRLADSGQKRGLFCQRETGGVWGHEGGGGLARLKGVIGGGWWGIGFGWKELECWAENGA